MQFAMYQYLSLYNVYGFVELSLCTVYSQCLQLNLDIHSNVIPGCYRAVCMVYEKVNFGWSDYRSGFLLELSLCHVFGQSLRLQVVFYINFTNVIPGCYQAVCDLRDGGQLRLV